MNSAQLSHDDVTVFPKRFRLRLSDVPASASGYAKALFMVLPEAFVLAQESATDNRYMQTSQEISSDRARRQALALAKKLREAGQSVILFPGDANCPDGVFPNNAFATRAGGFVCGAMRHPIRQQETERTDVLHFFRDVLRYQQLSLRAGSIAELTGSLVIDRARNIGFCGLSERCNLLGAYSMHEAFALRHSFVFNLAPSEYHTNVVMSALGGHGLVLAEDGFESADCAHALAALYGDAVVWLSPGEKANFVGNCIALSAAGGRRAQLWMSARALDMLAAKNRSALEKLGFRLMSVELDEIEKAGGSLRCMIGEIY
jgi:hypothetical protein